MFVICRSPKGGVGTSVVAAALALLVIGWAANTSAVGDLFDAVIDSVARRVG